MGKSGDSNVINAWAKGKGMGDAGFFFSDDVIPLCPRF
jgi:hypothetical protein